MWPGSARADVGRETCAVVHPAAFEVGVAASVDPAELETADPAATHPLPASGVLVCARADDPRCSPLSAEDTPTSPDIPARAFAMLPVRVALPALSLRECAFGATAILGPHTAPGSRLERPPRP
jgi:hypothetical protein